MVYWKKKKQNTKIPFTNTLDIHKTIFMCEWENKTNFMVEISYVDRGYESYK